MRLSTSTCQTSYWYFCYSCQPVSCYFPFEGSGRMQTQETWLLRKLPCIMYRCAIKGNNSDIFVTVKFLQGRWCAKHNPITLALITHTREGNLHAPFTKVCLSVGDERASTRSFGQILSIRSCSIWRRREHKKKTQPKTSKTVSLRLAKCKMYLHPCVRWFTSLLRFATFLQKHRKITRAINAANEGKVKKGGFLLPKLSCWLT